MHSSVMHKADWGVCMKGVLDKPRPRGNAYACGFECDWMARASKDGNGETSVFPHICGNSMILY
jgi:hypothetical protein